MKSFEVLESEKIENGSVAGKKMGGCDNPAVIKVIGAGGGGSNAIGNMMSSNMNFVDFIVANTDSQALSKSPAPIKLQLGAKLTNGLGAGGDPTIGEKAAQESKDIITEALKDADMVFITAGMGGGTGTGSAPIIAKIAKEMGILTIGVVTKPFSFEGKVRMKLAEEGIKKLKESVDSVIIIPNQNLAQLVPARTPVEVAFKKADDVLTQAVQGISDLIYKPGVVNLDLADVRSAMTNQGNAHMGVGIGEGENRAVDAATNALNNPLLEESHFEGATQLLVSICGNKVFMDEITEIMEIINASADANVSTCFGTILDPSMGDKISVTLVATGFPSNNFSKFGQVQEDSKNNDDGLSSNNDSFISSKQWDEIRKPKAPTISGLGLRNQKSEHIDSENNDPILDEDTSLFKINVPSDGIDLDIPTYYRTRR